jgi:hypothetical protein
LALTSASRGETVASLTGPTVALLNSPYNRKFDKLYYGTPRLLQDGRLCGGIRAFDAQGSVEVLVVIVRNEVLLGIFRRDAALHGMAVEAEVFLFRNTRRADRRTFEDVDLRLDDIDTGHDFCDGVLDLDARIDFDEVEFARILSIRFSTVPAPI